MIRDARELGQGEVLDADLCIVGAGPAGIALARELRDTLRICILESGGERPARLTRSLGRGDSSGLRYIPLHRARERCLGGTTSRWSGWCCPLDDIDFAEREWVPRSGWPFDSADLAPFYARSRPLFDLPAARTPEETQVPWAESLRARHVELSPTDFGLRYQSELGAASDANLYLHATAVALECPPPHRQVTRVLARARDRREFSVHARRVVLAAGGIENARLLLASSDVLRSRPADERDLVGRFFMEHVYLNLGSLRPPDDPDLLAPFTFEQHARPPRAGAGSTIFPAPELQRQERIGNCGLYFLERPRHKAMRDLYADGPVALGRLREALLGNERPRELAEDAYRALRGAPEIARVLLRKGLDSFRSPQRLLMRVFLEQAPDPESRVTLSSRTDSLGQPRARLNWRLGPLERHTLRRFTHVVTRGLRSNEIGRIEWLQADDAGWPASLTGGGHHMGTTRMGASPREAVVDVNCRVFGVDNLYVAGSSVFPTSGAANPTLTIAALALRLADHLRANAV